MSCVYRGYHAVDWDGVIHVVEREGAPHDRMLLVMYCAYRLPSIYVLSRLETVTCLGCIARIEE